MTPRPPTAPPGYNKRVRHRVTQNGLGYRPVNDWGDGDLPAPWAEGDVVELVDGAWMDRIYDDHGPGFYIVSYATSISEGDAWYFRLYRPGADRGSDRLHVAFADRCDWDEDVDWMAGCTLIDTADPAGLALRERMLAEGWRYEDHWDKCPTCGNVTRKRAAS